MSPRSITRLFFVLSLLFAIIMAVMTEPVDDPSLGDYYNSFFNRMGSFDRYYDILFIFIFISFIFAGIGIIAGTLEYIGEKKEETEVYQNFKSYAGLLMYLFFLVYGYIFLFSVMSISEFLIYTLNWTFPEGASTVGMFFSYMLFDSFILMVIGSILFGLKTFKYGIRSKEFYKTKYDPSVTDISKNQKFFRQMWGCTIGTIGVFSAIIVFIIELHPDAVSETGSFYIPKAFFFLMSALQSIYFYLHKEQYIDQLKPLDKQFGLKVGKGPLKSKTKNSQKLPPQNISFDEDEDEEDIDSDLKFED